MAYAKDTNVSQTASLLEIEKTLERYGKDLKEFTTLETELRTNVDRMTQKLVWDYKQVPHLVCQTNSVNEGGDWKGFFNAKK